MILSAETKILIQGITGKEGQRALEFMRAENAAVVAGVTPGKGGQQVDGVSVYESVSDALEKHPEITASSVYVPPRFVLSAGMEALDAGLQVVHIFAENVPVQDSLKLFTRANEQGSRVIGPSSIGVVRPGQTKLGSIGAAKTNSFLPATASKPGVAIISKSGGMASEIAQMFTAVDIPQSFVIGIGGDRIIGTTYADLYNELVADPETNAIVIIGEIGGSYEENLAEKIQSSPEAKPVIAFISGRFAETLPQGVSFGHAGAIVSATVGTREGKIAALSDAGAHIAESPEDIVEVVQRIVYGK